MQRNTIGQHTKVKRCATRIPPKYRWRTQVLANFK